jgi:hypothetical protein
VQVNFNSLAQCSTMRALAQAYCSAQPIWAELDPAQKKIERVEIKILHVLEKIYFNNLFTDIRIRNKKNKKYILIFLA